MGDSSRQRQREKRLKKPHKEGAIRRENSMMEMTQLDHEQMRILIIDTKNQVIDNISSYQETANIDLTPEGVVFYLRVI